MRSKQKFFSLLMALLLVFASSSGTVVQAKGSTGGKSVNLHAKM